MQDRTAGVVIIGNEILSGKTQDSNSPFLAKELRKLGVALRRIVVIPDELEDIARTVRDFHHGYDLVFTSGGVGPTHDDVTIEGVARALGRRVISHPLLERKLRDNVASRSVNPAYLKMAETPEGADLLGCDTLRFPTIKVENIYVLPGIPEIFRLKFLALKDQFAVDPYHLKVVYTKEFESAIAGYLSETLDAYPELMLGSYPRTGDGEYRVKLTLESKDEDYVERAFAHLLKILPHGCVVKTEG